MTEGEWKHCDIPRYMLSYFRDKASPRKLRLFAVACCRNEWHLLTDIRAQQAVVAAELLADSEATEEDRRKARHGAQQARGDARNQRGLRAAIRAAYETTDPDVYLAACRGSEYIAPSMFSAEDNRKQATHAAFLRDIFGNPFRPVVADPSWLTSTVVALAEGIYQDRAFDRLPILADALQDAGCENADVLTHCCGGRGDRGEPMGGSPHPPDGPHVRGCWVVDVFTGRT